MKIFCCNCEKNINAELVTGSDIYDSRPDLCFIPFWRCNTCLAHVGCHYKSSKVLKPLGPIPSRQVRKIRAIVHRWIDPVWQSGVVSRTQMYKMIGDELGYSSYHTGNIKSVEEGDRVIRVVKYIRAKLSFEEPVSTY